MRSYARLCAPVFFCLLVAGCGSQKGLDSRIYTMGERVETGPLIYRVLDTEWREQLGEGAGARAPRERFLIVRVAVTNRGAANSSIPRMKVVDAQGKIHEEVTDGRGVTEWLGYLRSIKPAETARGRVLFDVPQAAYRLEVADDNEAETQSRARIDLPIQLSAPGIRTGQ